jgi:peptidoglycan/xylan/chitin deacetylase (PgdA/CDA1 family)
MVLPFMRAEGEEAAVWRDSKGDSCPALVRSARGLEATFDVGNLLRSILEERYLPGGRNWFRCLPFRYQRLPGGVRLAVFKAISGIQRRRARHSVFPQYPVDVAGDLLHHLGVQVEQGPPRPRWPEGKAFAITLTHDVDTADGQRFARRMADRVRKRGLKAAWFVVGRAYPLDFAFWEELLLESHEIGLHGVLHDNRLADLPEPEIARRLDSCRNAIERLSIIGFRSPTFRVSDALYAQVARRFRYDSSVPDTDLAGPWYPRRGCCTVFPFQRRGLAVLPVTLLPEDKHRLLGLTDDQMVESWRRKLSVVRCIGGLANLVIHSEPHLWPGRAAEQCYDRLLELLLEFPDAWLTTPREITDLYRRAQGEFTGIQRQPPSSPS